VDTVVLGPQRKYPLQENGGIFFVDLSIVGNNTINTHPFTSLNESLIETKEFWETIRSDLIKLRDIKMGKIDENSATVIDSDICLAA
jgi:hypothetical protein